MTSISVREKLQAHRKVPRLATQVVDEAARTLPVRNRAGMMNARVMPIKSASPSTNRRSATSGLAILWPTMIGRAEHIGLVNHVVTAERLMDKARELAVKFATGPRLRLRVTKRAIHAAIYDRLAAHMEYEAAMQAHMIRGRRIAAVTVTRPLAPSGTIASRRRPAAFSSAAF